MEINMKEKNTYALIWDMDGTMVDTRETHWLVWKQTLAAENYDLDHETFLKTFGQRNDTILHGLLGVDLPDADAVRIGDAKEKMFRDVLKEHGVQLLPGAGQLIDQAVNRNLPQAVVSSAPRQNITTILEVLNRSDTFTALVCAEDVSHGKPHPEGFITASSKLGVSPSNCIVIEDAPAGLEAARRAGMACVGVLSTQEHLGEADSIVNSLEELSLADLETLLRQQGAL
jgi:beta-phosphoglucomutase family hydrolase